MSPIRILIFIAIVWIAWTLLRRSNVRRKKPAGKSQKVEYRQMVRCAHCNTHLPKEQALVSKDQWFCCEDHKDRYQKSNKPD